MLFSIDSIEEIKNLDDVGRKKSISLINKKFNVGSKLSVLFFVSFLLSFYIAPKIPIGDFLDVGYVMLIVAFFIWIVGYFSIINFIIKPRIQLIIEELNE